MARLGVWLVAVEPSLPRAGWALGLRASRSRKENTEIEADTPREAAEKTRHYQTKPGTSATVFEVAEIHAYAFRCTGDPVTIDLTPDTD